MSAATSLSDLTIHKLAQATTSTPEALMKEAFEKNLSLDGLLRLLDSFEKRDEFYAALLVTDKVGKTVIHRAFSSPEKLKTLLWTVSVKLDSASDSAQVFTLGNPLFDAQNNLGESHKVTWIIGSYADPLNY